MSITWDDAKEQVRNATEIVDLISTYMTLRRQGANYVGTCPWHDDARPSFQVNPTRQSWRCWVCDIGGDAFSFIMKRESVDFREALELLAQRAGIQLPRRGKVRDGHDKRSLFSVLTWAERQFYEYLTQSSDAEIAREYLRNRGITDESIKKFRVGFSPDSWDWLIQKARSESITDEQLRTTGLTSFSEQSRSAYDRFRGRVLFSIRDPQARTVGFGGRVMPGADEKAGAKYVNSPETKMFAKSELLYALDTVRDEVSRMRHVVVVEGYTDAIMAYQQGVKNVVAVLGTALNERHIHLLRRYCDRVTLVLDGDEAGQRRTNEILQLFLRHSIDLRIASMPVGQDPCDFVQANGAEAFNDLVKSAPDALNHKITVVTSGVDLQNDLHGSNQAMEEILGALAQINKNKAMDVAQAQLKERQALALLSRRFNLSESDLRERIRAIRARQKPSSRQRTDDPHPPKPAKIALDDWDRELLELFVAASEATLPEIVARVSETIGETQLRTEPARELFGVYRQRSERGQPLAFEEVMLALEAPELKSLLVELDESAAKKAELSNQTSECLEALLQAFTRRDLKGQNRSEIRRLQNEDMSEEEQLEALQKILSNQRSQQGIQTPTDG